MKKLTSIALTILLCSCASSNSRYSQEHDSIPDQVPTLAQLQDAVPKNEPKSRGGNKDYEQWGVQYSVLDSAKGFSADGIASWYGEKFHGRATSNGEIYDMYAMTAAHKSLPLPSYVRVTNKANGKSVVVRVNDRGPFHEDRIIDLSYSAAYKLDMVRTGTAQVHVEAITDFNDIVQVRPISKRDEFAEDVVVKRSPTSTQQTNVAKGFYIQVMATGDEFKAKQTAEKLASLYRHEAIWPEQDGIFRVQLGPINDPDRQTYLLNLLKKMGYPKAFARLN
ncbi:septal ring lytic transglycosylase RlpA family protein [Thalassotalea agarivorans]|uniref:Endolytic peptidoglycan transglycosylase RlpA n=1 Tax=Thalassotalea agarivorans TaxID=349064 RepID=A0A1I0HXT7_THASX|nr:septal ring lytic transglycosylase RlpA family protein [Thalassotalea agarivorans]SET88899.1 rare lipoprotein A [Thalassotalea agarivorans]